MIDRICFYIERNTTNEAIFRRVSDLMKNKVSGIGEGGRLLYEKGNYNGLSVSLSQYRLSVQVSLTKNHTGSNVYGMRFNDIQDALHSLLSLLRITATEATMTELEFGNAFCMNNEPKEYTRVLADIGYLARFTREKVNTTLYYKQKSKLRELIFYDKLKEMESRKEKLPTGLQNLLRYEMSLRRGALKKYLPTRTLADFQDKAVYKRLFGLWKDYFEQIYNNASASATEKKNSKSNLYLRFIQANNIDINELFKYASENLRGNKNAHRIKKEIQEFCSNQDKTDSYLLSEMRDRVRETFLNQ